MRLLFIFISLHTMLYGGAVVLINDSPFTLTAVVKTQDGTFIGQDVLQPGEQKSQVTDLKPTQLSQPRYGYSTSITPYTVIWKCPNGGYYSVCSTVSPGSLVKSNACPGSYFCRPQEKKSKKPPCCTPCEQGK